MDVIKNSKGKLYMVDFNSDIPNGLPKLDKDYWAKQKGTDNQNQDPLFDINTKFTLENDLAKISVFNGKKK